MAAGDNRVYEVHPEVSFVKLACRYLEFSKKTWNGHNVRRKLLADHGIKIPDVLDDARTVGADDILNRSQGEMRRRW